MSATKHALLGVAGSIIRAIGALNNDQHTHIWNNNPLRLSSLSHLPSSSLIFNEEKMERREKCLNKGVCKLEAALKSMQLQPQKRNALLTEYCGGNGQGNRGRTTTTAITDAEGINSVKRPSAHDQMRGKQGERAAYLFHLIYWGPN
ncbi:hypothetical protein ACH5RR_028006 [Cinchona calisaya]|uniref:Uncharacterized protein n=1 Tax=Cinchona calisaya TaxID=153742 RepID=A0ABD2YR42_9GENT